MANQVTDNRTLVADGTAVSNWEDIGGTARAVDTEISYGSYSGSIGAYATTTRDATMYNNTTTGLFSSGDHAYLLINCGIVGLLDTKALGGMTVRVTGATITDWAEFELFGSDDWPNAFDGGWSQIVVDIDELLANPTNTNGTPPTVGNIQRFGVTYITASVMPRMADNFWVGGFFILGASTPAIIVEGRDGGTSDWDFAGIIADTGIFDSAMLKPGPGGSVVCRGPIEYGINDTSTHAFLETNKTLLWDFQEVMLDGFYGLSALGNSGGTTNVTFGIKTGTGDAATGAQGGVIQAASNGARWAMDFNDPNVDGVNFYGVQMQHGGDFLLDDPAVSCINVSYIDCGSALISNSEQLRISVINAGTADGVAFMTTDDLSDIVFSSFEFSDGHGVELTTPRVATQVSKGNLFTGYGGTPGDNNTPSSGSTDAAIHNNAAGAVEISITDGGTTPSARNGASATTDFVASFNYELTGLDAGADVTIVDITVPASPTELFNEVAGVDGIVTYAFDGALSGTSIGVYIRNTVIVNNEFDDTLPSADVSFPAEQRADTVYFNP